jgi:hypothetical protein
VSFQPNQPKEPNKPFLMPALGLTNRVERVECPCVQSTANLEPYPKRWKGI